MKNTLYLAIYILLLASVIAPSFVQLQTPEEQNQTRERIVTDAQNASAQSILGNNLLIALVALIPSVGWVQTTIVMFQTGISVSSFNSVETILLNPFLYWENAVYAMMIYYSIQIMICLFNATEHRNMTEAKEALKILKTAVFRATIILTVLAFIEMLMIRT
jgi:hypothetical protein